MLLISLLRSGVILEQHYSEPTCSPTRGAVLTGRYPINIGLHPGALTPLSPVGLPTNVTTLADKLRSANYSTHAVGKWHLGICNKDYWPTSRGFDHFSGFLGGTTDYITHRTDGAECSMGIAGYDYREDYEVDDAASGTYDTYLIRDKAIEVITNHDVSHPLFLYLPFHAPHDPLQVDKSYQDMYSDIPDTSRQKYLGMVTALDDAVGAIIDSLKESELYENSVIVFLSDNGGPGGNWPPTIGSYIMEYGASNWPLRGSKLTLFEGGTRTVSFIHSPKYFVPRVETALFHATDWFPTILNAAGLDHEDDLDGVDQWERLKDSSKPEPREEMLYNMFLPSDDIYGVWNGIDSWPPISAIRVGDWKYIWRAYGFSGWSTPAEQGPDNDPGVPEEVTHQLFNLAADPAERENLAELEPDIALELLNKLKATYERMGAAGNYSYPPPNPQGRPENHGGIWGDGWC